MTSHAKLPGRRDRRGNEPGGCVTILGVFLLAVLVILLLGCGREVITAHRFGPEGKPLLAVTYERTGTDIAVEEIILERPELLDSEGNIVVPGLKLQIKGIVAIDQTARVAGQAIDVAGKAIDLAKKAPVP